MCLLDSYANFKRNLDPYPPNIRGWINPFTPLLGDHKVHIMTFKKHENIIKKK